MNHCSSDRTESGWRLQAWLVLAIAAVLLYGCAGQTPQGGAQSQESETATGDSSNPFYSDPVCNQTFALCISARCTGDPDSTQVGDTVECACEVVDGFSIGGTSCSDRAAQGDTLYSTYAFYQSTAGYPLMTCTGGKYADCYNQPCKYDPQHPELGAVCSCPVLAVSDDSTFITRGGSCDSSACSTTIWSGAPTESNSQVNAMLATDLGLASAPRDWACSSEGS